MSRHEREHALGFGKPPLYSRFGKGRSGNPKGRPKRTRNLVAVVKAVAQKQGKFGRHSEGSNPALSATRSVSPEN
jgi:hypothetical protein